MNVCHGTLNIKILTLHLKLAHFAFYCADISFASVCNNASLNFIKSIVTMNKNAASYIFKKNMI